MSGTHLTPDGSSGHADALRDEVTQLQEALRSQRDIGMAIGMVSARYGCSTEQAWRTMLRVSQDSNTKIRTIARVLVKTHDGCADAEETERAGVDRPAPPCLRLARSTGDVAGSVSVNIDQADLAASLRRLTVSREDNGSVVSALHQVLDACVHLFDVGGAGILVADEQDMLRYVAATDGPGRILETTETEAGEGPCTEAFVTAGVITTSDVTAESDRWPTLARVLADQPVRAVMGIPVRMGGVPIGTLDVYQEHAHDWDESEVAALERYAEVDRHDA